MYAMYIRTCYLGVAVYVCIRAHLDYMTQPCDTRHNFFKLFRNEYPPQDKNPTLTPPKNFPPDFVLNCTNPLLKANKLPWI